MSPFNALFAAFARPFRTRSEAGARSRRSGDRRRRQRVAEARLGECEQLEPKQVMAANLLAAIADQVITAAAPVTIDLASHFDETAVKGTVVKFQTNAPSANDRFFVELFDKSGVTNVAGGAAVRTPTTATNFLSYVNDNSYDNTLIHRAVDIFVVQGGGYKAPTLSADQPGSDPVAVTARAAITNEEGNANQRGTIAMAKLSGQTNSATNQFYFNLGNNTNLNTENGGYAVFGKVLGSGMTVIDTIAAVETYDATTYYGNGALSDLPLWNINADNIIDPQDFVTFEDVSVVPETALMSFTVTLSDTSKIKASVMNGQLVLERVAEQTGTVEVTISATSSLGGNAVIETFDVNLGARVPVLTDIETSGSTKLQRDASGKLYANGVAIYNTFGGETHLTVNPFAGHTVVAVEDLGAAGKQLVMQSSSQIVIWTLDATWKRDLSVSAQRIDLSSTAAVESRENIFAVDFNGGGIGSQLPVLSDLEVAGSTKLQRDASGKLYANGVAIYNTFGGETHLTVNPFPGFTVVAVEDLGAAGKQLVMQSSSEIVIWTLDATWKRDLSVPAQRIDLTNTTPIEAREALFGVDFNGGGIAS